MNTPPYYQDGPQNRFIQEIIDKKHDHEFIWYQPYNIDVEIVFTNIILRRVIGDAFFEWCSPRKYNYSFGKAQYYKDHKFKFEKIPIRIHSNSSCFNVIPRGVFPYENIGITNIWIVIENPNNIRMTDIVNDIIFDYGGIRLQRYATHDIEVEINLNARMLGVDGVTYKDGKIYIPLLVPHNSFILNDIHSAATIKVRGNSNNILFEIWGNICDTNAFPILAGTRNLSHNFYSVHYKSEFTGAEIFESGGINRSKSINFNQPTYAVYITNISKARILSMRLFLYSSPGVRYEEPIYGDEYPLNDVEWFDNHVIIWFNRDFLQLDKMNKCINFMTTSRSHLVIENTYTKEENHAICHVCMGLQVMKHSWGNKSEYIITI